MPLATLSDFLVNNPDSDNQSKSDIVALSNGNFFVAWRSFDGTLEFDYDVHGKIFNSSGSTVVGDYKISNPSTEQQSYPSVTAKWINSR